MCIIPIVVPGRPMSGEVGRVSSTGAAWRHKNAGTIDVPVPLVLLPLSNIYEYCLYYNTADSRLFSINTTRSPFL